MGRIIDLEIVDMETESQAKEKVEWEFMEKHNDWHAAEGPKKRKITIRVN